MKNKLTGWKDVYSFTLVQLLKSKAYRISFFILVILVLISMPLVSMIMFDNEDENAPIPVNKVYVYNDTSLSDLDFTGITNPKLSETKFESMKEDYDTVADRITEKENTSVILTISDENDSYLLHLSMAKSGPVKQSHLQTLGDLIHFEFQQMNMSNVGITNEQALLLNSPVMSKVTLTDINGNAIEEELSAISSSEYWFVYGILFFVLMATMLTGTQVATSVVTDKSTRVVEFLLINVKPLALMVGKVFSMMTAAMIQMLSMVAALFVSNKISTALTPENDSLLSQLLPSDLFSNINPLNLLLCIILVFLGMIFYSVLAALAGATVSRLEELNEGMTLFTLISLVGVYMGLGAANVLMGSGTNGYVTFTFLFPLSSPFILPGAILVGKAGFNIVFIAIVLELAFIILLFNFVAKIYETLILHNGNTIKVKQLFQLSKHSS
ncbi:MAG: ABC transporter permease [Clostridiales bacterium]|nr:ABC transporter permease [Clostridiales bacterium]